MTFMIYDAIHDHIWPDRPINTLKSVFVFQNESSSNAALDGLYLSWSETREVIVDTQTIQFCTAMSEIVKIWADM